MKVLFLTNWYPSRDTPARAVWVREHAKAVRRLDEVVVLHTAGSDRRLTTLWKVEEESEASAAEGVPTYRVWYREPAARWASYVIYLWSTLAAFRHISRLGFSPDVIHVHVYDAGGPGLLLGKLHRVPVVVSEHFSSFLRRSLGRLDLYKARAAFRWADRVLPVSYTLKRAIEGYGIAARFEVVPNVVDPAVFFPTVDAFVETRPKRLLFVGQLTPVKGLPYLFEALSKLGRMRTDWRLDVVGDGEARRDLEQLATGLNLRARITFHGVKGRHDVAELMRRADLFVLPSLCETFSAPAAEALASGTPVLATRCGGPEEFIVDEVGSLVPAADAAALARGLRHMLDTLDRYSRARIRQYAVERFSPEVVGAMLHAVYESLGRR